jgi:PTH1 family peptidyl-tRNA hydrolase
LRLFRFFARAERERVTHLIVGLGNPGVQYARTRHNIGFRVVEEFARRHNAANWRSKFHARIAHVFEMDALLVLPQTFMNDSGSAVAPIAGFYKVPHENVLAVCDDIALPFAQLRMRAAGSSGGHNGLRSIIDVLGTENFPRMRIGVGRSSPDAIGVVLGSFSAAEERALPEVIDRAIGGIERWLRGGTEAAIALVNANGGAPPAGQ